jgi:hypothetical protein
MEVEGEWNLKVLRFKHCLGMKDKQSSLLYCNKSSYQDKRKYMLPIETGIKDKTENKK